MNKDREDFDPNEWGNKGNDDRIMSYSNHEWTEERKQQHSKKLKTLYESKSYKEDWHAKNLIKYGDSAYCKKITKHLVKLNKERYNDTVYVFRTPGNDLLDFYDRMQKEQAFSKCVIPPSVVFQIRFREQYPIGKKMSRIKEICKPYIDFDTMKPGNSFTKDIHKRAFKWLVDEPHEAYEFDTYQGILDFILKEYNSKSFIPISPYSKTKPKTEHVFKHSKLAGCSIIAVKK